MYISSIGFRLDYQKIVLEKIELTTIKIFIWFDKVNHPFSRGSEIIKINRCRMFTQFYTLLAVKVVTLSKITIKNLDYVFVSCSRLLWRMRMRNWHIRPWLLEYCGQ